MKLFLFVSSPSDWLQSILFVSSIRDSFSFLVVLQLYMQVVAFDWSVGLPFAHSPQDLVIIGLDLDFDVCCPLIVLDFIKSWNVTWSFLLMFVRSVGVWCFLFSNINIFATMFHHCKLNQIFYPFVFLRCPCLYVIMKLSCLLPTTMIFFSRIACFDTTLDHSCFW